MKKNYLKKVMALGLTAVMTLGLGACGSSSSTASTASSSGTASTTEATSGASSTAASGESYGSKHKVLRVGIECAYAPYNWTQESEEVGNGDKAVKIANNEGYAYGYDVKVAQMIADKLGWDLEIYKSDWSAIFMGLNSGTYDCIMSGICYSDERDKTLDFTTPYYCRKITATVRADSEFADFTSLDQFKGKNAKVTSQMGTNFVDYKSEIPDGESVTDYETSGEAFQAVLNSTADVCILDQTTSSSALMTMDGLKVLDLPDDAFTVPEGASNDCCIAFKEGDPERDEVNEAMKEIGWTTDNKSQFDDLMDEMLKYQPSQG
ncbi:MAG: transporter substrate-binding domain-containing protein [Lachnospiraceae bacterium]|nr:transporter substrate-binding domain-containing protein [Lachnospiraceae bacterium]